MKKYLLFLITFILIGVHNIAAASCDELQCISCTYDVGIYKIKYDVQADGFGGATITDRQYIKTDTESRLVYNFLDDTKYPISSENFIVNNELLSCPSNIYLKYAAGASTTIGVTLSFKVFSDSKSYESLSNSSDNKKPFIIDSNQAGKACNYTGYPNIPIIIRRVGDELKYEIGQNYEIATSDLKVNDFPEDENGECPTIYISCGSYSNNKFCRFYKEATDIDIMQNNPGQSGNDVPSGEDVGADNPNNSSNSNNNTADISNFCEEEEVQHAFRLAGYILLIVKILIPILLIIFGVIDYSKAIISSNDSALQKSTSSLVTRVIAAVVIFLLPTVINFVFGLIPTAELNGKYCKCRTCLYKPGKCGKCVLTSQG